MKLLGQLTEEDRLAAIIRGSSFTICYSVFLVHQFAVEFLVKIKKYHGKFWLHVIMCLTASH